MKNTIFLSMAMALIVIVSSCKKEEMNTNNQPTDPYERNLALVDTNAAFYLAADVEGLAGYTKLIIQPGQNNGTLEIIPPICPGGGEERYTFRYFSSQVKFIVYMGDGTTNGTRYEYRRDESKPFVSAHGEMDGVDIWMLRSDTALFCSSSAQSENVPNVFEKVYRNGHVTGKFNCVIGEFTGSSKIYLRNAVYKII